jgi:hypothetical protein
MVKWKYAYILLPIVILLGACNVTGTSGCDQPPKEGFSETDLVGTWSAMGSQGDNTIIIRENGQYKQIMKVKRTGFNYESDWRPWRITYSEQGLAYLHLDGLLMCAYWDQMDCSTGQTGIEPFALGDTQDPYGDLTSWYDGCQKKWVSTPGEAVFIVFGLQNASNIAPRGLDLVPLTKNPDGPSGPTFVLKEQVLSTTTPEP